MSKIYTVANSKKLNKMVELHDNITFKDTIDKIDDLDYFVEHYNKPLIITAILCNNCEAFKLIINHKSMFSKKYEQCYIAFEETWMFYIFDRYLKNKCITTENFINELTKTNMTVEFAIIKYIPTVEIFKKIIHMIDMKTIYGGFGMFELKNKENDFIEFLMEYLLAEKKELFTDNIKSAILNIALDRKNSNKILDLLKNDNFDITKKDEGIPSIFYNYEYFKDCHYDLNLLDRIMISNISMCVSFSYNLNYIIDNLELFRKNFKECHDDKYELLNKFIFNEIVFGFRSSLSDVKKQKELFISAINFIASLHLHKNGSIYDKIKYIDDFERIIKDDNNDRKETLKLFFN
jgi:hypothetical protein